MQSICSRVVMLAVVSAALLLSADAASPFSGRWDLTIMTPKGSYPSWMEFADEGGTPAIRMVGRTGSVHAVHNAKVEGTRLTFEDGPSPGAWQLNVKDRKLTGQSPDGPVIGVPAPSLKYPAGHKEPDAWSGPDRLFNGHDL